MKHLLLIAVAGLLIAAFGASPGAGLHCNGVITQIVVGPETFYIDDRSMEGGPTNHWFYQEGNGIKGLQSGGDVSVFEDIGPSFTDPCAHWPWDILLI